MRGKIIAGDNLLRAIIYTRQSLAKDGDELGVQRQEAECRRLCELRRYSVVRVLTDNNQSASTGKRPAYKELLRSLEAGMAEVVVVLRLDRLLRKLTELETLIELSERTGVSIVTVQGDLDISNAQGRLLGRILASVARSEVEVKSERHKLANRQRATQGKPHGSRRPFGYEPDMLTIRESEAELLREMARRIIGGVGYKHVAYWLNRSGHTTTLGRQWYPVTVRNLLRKPRYGGYREYRGELFPAQWEAIFEPDLYERLQLAMKLKQQQAPDRPRGRKYVLTGLLKCGHCGLPLTGTVMVDRPGAPKRRVYMCRGWRDTGMVKGCGKVRRNAEALEHYIRESVLDRLDTPDLAALLGDDDGELRALLELRQTQQLRLDSLVDDYATNVLNRNQFERAKTTAENALGEIDKRIDELSRRSLRIDLGLSHTLRQSWHEHDDEWRRKLIGLLVKSVTVNPGLTKPFYIADGTRYRFDPKLISIDWIA